MWLYVCLKGMPASNTFIGLLIIYYGVSVFLLLIFHLVPGMCNVEIMLLVKWLADMWAATIALIHYNFVYYCLTYIKIMVVARSASSENKKSINGSKNCFGIQLLLCMAQLSI